MLRLLALVLLLANAAYFAWSQGLLLTWGVGPAQQSEPQRLAQQIRPEAMRILKSDEAKRIEAAFAAAAKAPECLQVSPLDEAQVAAVRPLLGAWPVGSWTIDSAVEPARWIVYMGKYPTIDHVIRKKAELRQLGISFEPLSNPALEPGLSLGGHGSEESALKQLEALAERGVRTARVLQERQEVKGQRLMVPVADDTLRGRLDELRALLGGKVARACR